MDIAKLKKVSTPILLIALLFFITSGAASAGTISGQVTDKADGVALYRATVSITPVAGGKSTGTMTDENGNYEIKNLPAGAYNISISSMGYSPHTISNVTIGESETKTITASLASTFINMDAVSVSVSRRPEKIVDAPASVNVIDSKAIESRTVLTLTEHIKGATAVDVATTGLNQSNAVVRGFNNIFSGALLVLTDNRNARIPSLRFNAYNFIPTINEDIERIEIVSGPGSALYGPNAASGVMHMITKSPFSHQGTTVSIGGGERELFLGSFRHAGLAGDRIGYKLTAQYYQGLDWKHYEKAELEKPIIQNFRPTNKGPVFVGEPFENKRDFNIEKLSGEGRLDFLIGDDASLIFNGGFSRSSSIELTGLGAGQAIDWIYAYGQARFRYKNLFAQTFLNTSDAGDTYLLQTGQLIIDKSKVWAGQIQHRYTPQDKLSFTYGFDALLTRPNTEATINGRNEDDDKINEFGGYFQGEYKIDPKLKLLGAIRIDDHNRLKDLVVSPRAALAYKPTKNHSLRVTYNRAFSTPDNNNLFLDILSLADMGGMGERFAPALNGYNPGIDVRVQGVPETGFHWRFDDNGNPQFRSTFTPIAQLNSVPIPADGFISLNDPIFTAFMWSVGRDAVIGGFKADLASAGYDSATIAFLENSIETLVPGMIAGVGNRLMTLNMDTGELDASNVDAIADIDRLEPTITQTIELGYNGLIGDRLKFGVDLYRTDKENFIGPLTVETPNVFLDPVALQSFLTNQIGSNISTNPADSAALDFLDANGNGPIDELITMFLTTPAGIPFGTITPDEAFDPTAILITYRNFGDINFYGADFSLAYHLNQNWDFGGTFSYISRNFFEKKEGQVHDIHLNAPKYKGSAYIQYQYPKYKLSANLRYRYVDAFDMASPFFGSYVSTYHLLDFNAGIDFMHDTHLALTIQNVLDNMHSEFVGAPELGRLTIVRLTQSF
ncbi:MAG: TonB-dependent receptor [candidate division Zixibacteria bacterium]